MSKNAGWILHGGVHSVHIGVQSVVTLTHRGRPEPENGTPVNMENRLHRDNGEGVAATPPPYPLNRGELRPVAHPRRLGDAHADWIGEHVLPDNSELGDE